MTQLERVKDEIRLSITPRGNPAAIRLAGLKPYDAIAARNGRFTPRTSAYEDQQVEEILAYSHEQKRNLKSPSHLKTLQNREKTQLHLYDHDERVAIRSAKEIGYEPRSDDDDIPLMKLTREKYVKYGFVVSDDSSLHSDESEQSTDDDSATNLSDAGNSDESEGEAGVRKSVVAKVVSKTQAKAKAGRWNPYSCDFTQLPALREKDILIKRPTARSYIVELVLQNWLRSDLSMGLRSEPFEELLRQLRLLPAEYAVSVYYAITKRLRPMSNKLFKLIFRCVEHYLPEHTKVFGSAYHYVKRK